MSRSRPVDASEFCAQTVGSQQVAHPSMRPTTRSAMPLGGKLAMQLVQHAGAGAHVGDGISGQPGGAIFRQPTSQRHKGKPRRTRPRCVKSFMRGPPFLRRWHWILRRRRYTGRGRDDHRKPEIVERAAYGPFPATSCCQVQGGLNALNAPRGRCNSASCACAAGFCATARRDASARYRPRPGQRRRAGSGKATCRP